MYEITLDVTEFIARMIEVNRIASDYEYEKPYETPADDALKEILNILDNKIGQWEYELRYDLKKRGKKQDGEDLDVEINRKKALS